jgi:hypothetical protein
MTYAHADSPKMDSVALIRQLLCSALCSSVPLLPSGCWCGEMALNPLIPQIVYFLMAGFHSPMVRPPRQGNPCAAAM